MINIIGIFIGHSSPGQPASQFLSGSHTIVSIDSISAEHQILNNHTGRGNHFLMRPQCQQSTSEQSTKLTSRLPVILGRGHWFRYISPHVLHSTSNQTPWNYTIIANLNQSVLFTCTWVPAYWMSVKKMKIERHCWHGGAMIFKQ